MGKILVRLAIVMVVGLLSVGIFLRAMGSRRWEFSIRGFERSDRIAPPRPGVIVFTGSSSIRFWETLTEDMQPLDVINRGFGGSEIADVNYYAQRVPYRPRAVVLYCGDNDLSWPSSKSPETVLDDFEQFVRIIHAQLPDTWIYYVSIKPTILRRKNWPKVQKANGLIEAFTKTQERVQFIDVAAAMLDAAGEPRRDLLKWDGLHPSPKCYRLWTSIIKPVLLQRFGPAAGSSLQSSSASGRLQGAHGL